MKTKDMSLDLHEYKSLSNMSQDELLYSIVYELMIRDKSDFIIEIFKMFFITSENKIEINFLELERIKEKYNVEEFSKIKNSRLTNSEIFKIILEWIQTEFYILMGIDAMSLYLDYFFFSDELKKLYYTLAPGQLFIEKRIYGAIDTMAYFHSDFVRVTKKLPPPPDDPTFHPRESIYYKRYQRPIITPPALSTAKECFLRIDVNLPKISLMQQLEKLVDIAKADNANIISNFEMSSLADGFNFKLDKEDFNATRKNFIDSLFIFDYIKLRQKEFATENEKNADKIQKQIEYIKKQNLPKNEKKLQISNIRYNDKQLTKKDIYDELAYILNLSIETIEIYEKNIKRLLKNQNYFKLIHGNLKN